MKKFAATLVLAGMLASTCAFAAKAKGDPDVPSAPWFQAVVQVALAMGGIR